MSEYWEERYKIGGTSGAGLYGDNAKRKALVINYYIKELEIKTISDIGCGAIGGILS